MPTTTPGGYWYNDVGQNLLSGFDGDPDNPAVIPGYAITDMLRRIPAARTAFNKMMPLMTLDEQDRLNLLANCVEGYAPYDMKFIEDTFMAGQNTVGIRTTGQYGGTRRGGNR